MDGQIAAGWYRHPQLGLIKISIDESNSWVYQCFSESGTRSLSTKKPLDQWTWALSQLDENR